VADADAKVELTRAELAAALKKWAVDGIANGWDFLTNDARCDDGADYLIHTIRLARGEGDPTKKEG
jgi:hypothetical protein